MNREEKNNLVPVWERATITLEEAAAYTGIGVRKLREMSRPAIMSCGLETGE